MPIKPSPLIRDLLLAIADHAVGFWGIFERPHSITYPLYQDVERVLKRAKYQRPAITKGISRLVQRQYVKVFEQNGHILVVLTEKGKERVWQYRLDSIGIVRPTVWDGKWRMVIFDIPEKRKSNREVFRNALRRLGFELLQESVAVHPFPCREEVYAIASIYAVLPYIRILEVDSVDPDDDLLNTFNLNE